MNISFNWLKDYVELGGMTPEELDDLLTFSGLEVEGVEKVETIKGGLEHVVIAQVLTCEPHPNSDHLHITTVDVGGDRPLDIVCGAPNVAAGQKVVCAQTGTKIYTSDTEFYEIKKGKLRGAVSEGMLCAADELQLGSDHDGIMVLPDDAPVGMPAKEYFHVEGDSVLEVAITANRSDATSHIGVARDVVAVLNTRQGKELKLRRPEPPALEPESSDTAVKVRVEEPELCPRYSGITIRNITVKDSPEWLQNKLRTVGLRPINNIVDITNFVLMEVGQPLHAFDADKIEGQAIVVKRLADGTTFRTLDDVERKLDSRDLMICADKPQGAEPLCIAGVFGGIDSGVTAKTRNIFIESAYFNPVSIRKTSKRHGLKTDASFRYERGADPNITVWALRRAAALVKELAGGEICGDMVDLYPTPIPQATVDINFERIFGLMGTRIPVEKIRTILTSLDITIEQEDTDGMRLRIPTCKVDVTRECDVVEEIMRIYGYDNIPFDERLSSCLSYSNKPNTAHLRNTIGDYLAANGFFEIMNNSLTKSDYYKDNPDFDASKSVAILNPLSRELDVMRQTLLYGGMECVARNINHKIHDQKLFEFGRAYLEVNPEATDTGKRYDETQHLSLFITGAETPENWMTGTIKSNFYHLKAHVTNILHRMRVDPTRLVIAAASEKYYAEGLSYTLKDSHKQLLSIGRLGKETLRRMDCKQEVYYADINWDLLLSIYPKKEVTYCEIAKFPEVRRDLALILRQEVTFDDVQRTAFATEKKLLKRVSLFDVYEGKGVTEGMKSYAVSFILQDDNKTLTDTQIDNVMSRLQKQMESQLGASIRQ
ncbi:MAG: phenylalanine--tRNA ligase subunit beta [Bacteroidales bacterium]|nr:phenylalanine--tRNA ligase subunit beta [Bacteroidales bacterium]